MKAAQAVADGETSEEDLIKDIPELQNVERKIASKRFVRKKVNLEFKCRTASVLVKSNTK